MEELGRRFDANQVNDYARRVNLLCSFVPDSVAEWVRDWVKDHDNSRWQARANPGISFIH